MRAVFLKGFNPKPSPENIRHTPFARLAEFVSRALGQPVPVEAVQLRPGDYRAVRAEVKLWLLLRGIDAEPESLPHPQLTRAHAAAGVAYVDERALEGR